MGKITPISIFISVKEITSSGFDVWMQKREDFWEFPGGKIENNERPEEAVAREVKEEVGIDLVRPQLFKIVSHSYSDSSVSLYIYVDHDRGMMPVSETQKWVAVDLQDGKLICSEKTWDANQKILEDLHAYFIDQLTGQTLDLLWE